MSRPWNPGPRSLKVIESATIRWTWCDFLLVFYSNFVTKTWDKLIWIKKCRDLENWVSGPSRSLEMSPIDRAHATSYWCYIVITALVSFLRYSKSKMSWPWNPGQCHSIDCLYGFLLVFYSNFVHNTRRFWDTWYSTYLYSDLETRVRGHSRASEPTSISHLGPPIIPINVPWQAWSDLSPISYHFWDRRRLASKTANFSHPRVFCVPTEGKWVSALGVKNLESYMGLPGREKKFDDIFSRLDIIQHQRDALTSQTDGQTADTGRQQRPRLRIASRGKT